MYLGNKRMFTPIKNFITYIQKNASGNSIFGGNSTTEESAKMETENMKIENETKTKTESSNATETKMQTESEEVKVIEHKIEMEAESSQESESENKLEMEADNSQEPQKKEEENKEDNSNEEEKKNEEFTQDSNSSQAKESETETKPTTGTSTVTTTTTVSTENSCEYEDFDIETQIESSIMLKKPVKVAATNGTEILEVKKTSNANCSLVISHDYNRNHALSPVDDELDDFRHDPMEVLGTTSSPCSNQNADEFCSVGSADEALERDAVTTADEYEEEGEEGIETEEEQKNMEETDFEEDEDERGNETENEQKEIIQLDDDDEEDEEFLDMESYRSKLNYLAIKHFIKFF